MSPCELLESPSKSKSKQVRPSVSKSIPNLHPLTCYAASAGRVGKLHRSSLANRSQTQAIPAQVACPHVLSQVRLLMANAIRCCFGVLLLAASSVAGPLEEWLGDMNINIAETVNQVSARGIRRARSISQDESKLIMVDVIPKSDLSSKDDSIMRNLVQRSTTKI